MRQADDGNCTVTPDIVPINLCCRFQENTTRVVACGLKHTVPCWGYVIDRQARPSLDMQKARSLGIATGPCLGMLKQGQPVVMPDGVVVRILS